MGAKCVDDDLVIFKRGESSKYVEISLFGAVFSPSFCAYLSTSNVARGSETSEVKPEDLFHCSMLPEGSRGCSISALCDHGT